MPYRGSDPVVVCYRHKAAGAAASCSRCLQPICEICVVYEATRPECPRCARRTRRVRQLGRAAAAVVLVSSSTLSLAAGLFVITRERSFPYGQFGPAVERLTAQLAATPCDREKILDLTNTLARAGDQRGIVRSGDAFFGRCGELPQLRWATYAAHARLQQNTAAIADATHLIAAAPDDKDYRWWRGVIYERLGRLDEAARDYRDALSIEPHLRSVPLNLADVYERAGRFDEAIDVLNTYLREYPTAAPQVGARFVRLQHLCSEPASSR